MDAEIIAIGSELLLGTTVDTNSAHIAGQLAACGVNVFRKATVGDNRARIAAVIAESLARADLVICTGGLGPTVDDVTREAIADATNRPLVFEHALLDHIAAFFAARGRQMSESNRQQAYVPQGARSIINPVGTAPIFILEADAGTVITLPGVPSEMRYLMEHVVLPYLRDERGITDVIVSRTLHATGMGESVIGERIADLMEGRNPTVGISAKRGRYELRITARASDHAAANALIDPVVLTIAERLGAAVIGDQTLDQQIGALLHERGLTVAVYEGQVYAAVLRALQESSHSDEWLRGAIIHPRDTAASHEAADLLARAGATRVRDQWRTDLALAAQMAAEPDPQTGSVASALVLLTPDGVAQQSYQFDPRQQQGWQIMGTVALAMLRRYLLEGTLA